MSTTNKIAYIGECKTGALDQPETIDSFEKFEETFANLDFLTEGLEDFIGIPPFEADKALSFVRTKMSVSLSDIVKKIQLELALKEDIESHLINGESFVKDYDDMLESILTTVKQYCK